MKRGYVKNYRVRPDIALSPLKHVRIKDTPFLFGASEAMSSSSSTRFFSDSKGKFKVVWTEVAAIFEMCEKGWKIMKARMRYI